MRGLRSETPKLQLWFIYVSVEPGFRVASYDVNIMQKNLCEVTGLQLLQFFLRPQIL